MALLPYTVTQTIHQRFLHACTQRNDTIDEVAISHLAEWILVRSTEKSTFIRKPTRLGSQLNESWWRYTPDMRWKHIGDWKSNNSLARLKYSLCFYSAFPASPRDVTFIFGPETPPSHVALLYEKLLFPVSLLFIGSFNADLNEVEALLTYWKERERDRQLWCCHIQITETKQRR